MSDFNPGILGIILWGIISFLFRKKKISNDPSVDIETNIELPESEHFDNIFYNEDILIDDEIFNESQKSEEFNDNLIPEYNDISISNEVDEEIAKSLDIKYCTSPKLNLLTTLRDTNSLKLAFVLKEVLDRPLALREYD